MTEELADLELLTAWRAGDTRAGSSLAQRHFDALHRFFCSKARGNEDDLIQQTFVACIESKEAFRGESTFRAYLFGLARHQLLTHYRRVYRRRELDFTTTSIHDLATSPTGLLSRRQEHELLAEALRGVPVDLQIALELTYWEDMSASEVAAVIGIPENTVYSRLRRARALLREALEKLIINPHERRIVIRLLHPAADGSEAP